MITLKIYIFTEGSKKIGLGHIFRCVALYNHLVKLGFFVEIIINGDETISPILNDVRHSIKNWLDPNILLNLPKSNISIIDSYLANYEQLNLVNIKSEVTCYLDDTNRIQYPPGIVVNGMPSANALGYKHDKGHILLLGKKYLTLREEFHKEKKLLTQKKANNVLLILGSSDVRGLIPLIINLFSKKFPQIRLRVIFGVGYLENEIVELSKQHNNFTPLKILTVEEIIQEMLEADFAVSAGGQTLLELVSLAVPTVTITVVENQELNIQNFIDEGVIINTCKWDDRSLIQCLNHTVIKMLDYELRYNLNDRMRYLFQENGTKNLVDKIIEVYQSKIEN